MAEEGNLAVPKTADSKDEVSPTVEATIKSPEPPRADQGTEASLKEGDDMADQDEAAIATVDKPETREAPLPEIGEDSKPAESGLQQEPETTTAEGGQAGAAGEPQEMGANGTPASAKKSSKRKSSGVPEHRSKKPNKKKSMVRMTHLDAQPGEYYFARLRSYPPWPSIICDEEMLPQSLLATRPVTTKQRDGTYNENFRDGGKRVHERTFPVMFLGTNEFAWIPNTELSPLNPEDCKNASEKSKTKGLFAAYQVAAEGHDLQYFKDMLADHQRALQEDEQTREAQAKAKQDKKKRKSADVVEEPEDEEMAVDGAEKPKSAKKRKKDVESEGESDKPVKTPKTATKLKLTTPKAPATGETGKKRPSSAKATKSKGTGAKKGKPAATAVASDEEEEAAETPKKEEPKVNPAEAKAKREKEIFYLRHRLQKGFLARDQAPKEEEMEAMSTYIAKLDSYDDLEISIIRETKISKVLKGIIKLADIPKESEYNFRGRSIDILKKWKHWDVPAIERETKQSSTKKNATPAANGVHNEVNGKEGSRGKDADATAVDTDEPMPDADTEAPEKESASPAVEKDTEVEAEAEPVAA
ncbi:hypothetical protein PRK78_003919 [Emydomyces testavorans]|uniref:PWWP domain-containing protein n=1 Tax=Emydomyces testavorans TaxID=2070801 RepID=A0AAF0IJ88_9EURO|nr:hypothetical protein PRK78_003919 [Emydomyces testavorans]